MQGRLRLLQAIIQNYQGPRAGWNMMHRRIFMILIGLQGKPLEAKRNINKHIFQQGFYSHLKREITKTDGMSNTPICMLDLEAARQCRLTHLHAQQFLNQLPSNEPLQISTKV